MVSTKIIIALCFVAVALAAEAEKPKGAQDLITDSTHGLGYAAYGGYPYATGGYPYAAGTYAKYAYPGYGYYPQAYPHGGYYGQGYYPGAGFGYGKYPYSLGYYG